MPAPNEKITAYTSETDSRAMTWVTSDNWILLMNEGSRIVGWKYFVPLAPPSQIAIRQEGVRGSNHLNPNIIESKGEKSEGLRMNERNIEPWLLTDLYKHLPISPSMFHKLCCVIIYKSLFFFRTHYILLISSVICSVPQTSNLML